MGTKTDIAFALTGISTFFGLIALVIGLFVLKIWLITSLITSTVKTTKHECGQTYGIERFANGNWFCSTVKK